MKLKTRFRILEFIIFGIVTSVIENAISVYVFGGQSLSLHMIPILIAIVTPFAVVEEFVVDHPSFWFRVCKTCGIKINERAIK